MHSLQSSTQTYVSVLLWGLNVGEEGMKNKFWRDSDLTVLREVELFVCNFIKTFPEPICELKCNYKLKLVFSDCCNAVPKGEKTQKNIF